MSIEAPKTVEETQPVETKSVEPTTETPAINDTPATEANTTEAPSTTPAVDATPTTNGVKKGETVVEATPASDGILGYKAPGFLKQLYFSKHFFWFSDEAVSSESLNAYIRSEKTHSVGHEHAAWARETGQGVLFYSKRAEDKSNPSGVILLHEVSNVTKEGLDVFSLKIGTHTHKFEASNSGERDSWVVAVEKKVEEARGLKDDVTGRDSYKKYLEEYAKTPAQVIAAAGGASRSKSKEPKKSLDAATATAPAATETKKEEAPVAPAPVEEKKTVQKERSQSRKRASIFGSILGKKDEKEAEQESKKEVKAEEKAEKKAEKQAVKEEKKEEAAIKKDEAQQDKSTSKATEAAEVGAVAALPAAAIVAADKKEEKKEDKDEEKTGTTTPTDKKAKRGSVFGSLFGKKGVTSPTAEKSEKEVGPTTPAKDDVPPVSETAPKLDEPIENKPIDTAAVTAPADTVVAEPTTQESAKDTTPTVTGESSPKTEKKGGFLAGFIKKAEAKKEEPKEEKKPIEPATTESSTTPAPIASTDGTTETPAAKEERPAHEKRRTSLFAGLGTIKRKNKDEKETSEATEQTPATETKHEKSPLPSKIGGLFRRPSKAVKSEEPKTETAPATEPKNETPAATESTPATEDGKPTDTVPEGTDSKIVGDVVPDELHTTVHDSVTTAPEVKATA